MREQGNLADRFICRQIKLLRHFGRHVTLGASVCVGGGIERIVSAGDDRISKVPELDSRVVRIQPVDVRILILREEDIGWLQDRKSVSVRPLEVAQSCAQTTYLEIQMDNLLPWFSRAVLIALLQYLAR